jgi:hypothetical protein
MKKQKKSPESLSFEQGYVCAVATLLRQHGASVYAKEMLRCIGKWDWSRIDPYDLEALEEHGLLPPEARRMTGIKN